MGVCELTDADCGGADEEAQRDAGALQKDVLANSGHGQAMKWSIGQLPHL